MKNLIKRHYIIVLISAIVLTIIAVSAVLTAQNDHKATPAPTQSIEKPVKAEKEPKEEPKEEPQEEVASDLPGKKEYEQVENGMTTDQIKELLGAPSSESESEIANIKTKTNVYNGKGDLGANIVVMFDNGKVMSKSQFGLK